MKTIIYRILAILSTVLGFAYVLLACALLVAHRPKLRSFRPSMQWRPWFAKKWKYSTTIGSGRGFHPEHLDSARIASHEMVHVRNFEDDSIFFVMLAGMELLMWQAPLWFRFVLTVPLVWVMLYAKAWIGAVLRGGHVYRDAEYERSAYAQTDVGPDGRSWLDRHLEETRKW